MNEASVAMDVAKAKEKRAEDMILQEKESGGEALRKERSYSARQMQQLKAKHDVAMKKLHHEHAAVLRVNEQKYDRDKVCSMCDAFLVSSNLTLCCLRIIPYHIITGQVDEEVARLRRQVD